MPERDTDGNAGARWCIDSGDVHSRDHADDLSGHHHQHGSHATTNGYFRHHTSGDPDGRRVTPGNRDVGGYGDECEHAGSRDADASIIGERL